MLKTVKILNNFKLNKAKNHFLKRTKFKKKNTQINFYPNYKKSEVKIELRTSSNPKTTRLLDKFREFARRIKRK
jgi:hypothetical protein